MQTQSGPSPSRSDLAKIHIAAKALGFDDDEYRLLLWDRYKVSSAKSLLPRQVWDILSFFRAKGWKATPAKRAKTSRPQPTDPMSRKILALWITMKKAGIVRDGSDLALGAYVKRITGVDALPWCTPSQKAQVIESLKKWQGRTNG